MSDERRRILDLLAQGKLSVDEAEQLLAAAASQAQPSASPAGSTADGKRPQFMRITVVKPAVGDRPAKTVNVRIPIALVRGGMRLGTMIPGIAGERIAERLKERGINFDPSTFKFEEFERVLRESGEMTIDVDSGGKQQVRISCEYA